MHFADHCFAVLAIVRFGLRCQPPHAVARSGGEDFPAAIESGLGIIPPSYMLRSLVGGHNMLLHDAHAKGRGSGCRGGDSVLRQRMPATVELP